MNFQIAKNQEDLQNCYHVIKELRPHLTFEDFIYIYTQSQVKDDYELVFITNDKNIVLAVMGYRILFDFVRGKHIYIDDLVITEMHRSLGLGAKLLKYAEQLAAEHQCKTLRLCTGVENNRAIKFYEKNGWVQRALAYTKKV